MRFTRPKHWNLEIEKQVIRHDEILHRPHWEALKNRFGFSIFHRSSIFHDLEKFLEENSITGKRCFEIGTWNGLTSAVLSKRFDEVVTVDIAHNNIKHEVLGFLGVKNVRCIDIASNADKEGVLQGLDIDCAFMDGNHAEDTETDFNLVKHCGRVIFHEVWDFQAPVWNLVQGFPKPEVLTGGFCFAMWQKGRLAPNKEAKPEDERA